MLLGHRVNEKETTKIVQMICENLTFGCKVLIENDNLLRENITHIVQEMLLFERDAGMKHSRNGFKQAFVCVKKRQEFGKLETEVGVRKGHDTSIRGKDREQGVWAMWRKC